MWGQAGNNWQHGIRVRIIPTRVGTRIISKRYSSGKKDHPHACGDKYLLPQILYKGVGSSPRVWGQVSALFPAFWCLRIIPTRVGTSYAHCTGIMQFEDHPHACGDKEAREYLKDGVKGSSPRVWGQAESCTAALYSARIIPTRVGTSSN